jgi:hypothetical protein
MKITRATIAVEIVILLSILVLVESLATTLTHTTNFMALVIGWGAYLGVRVAGGFVSRR